MTAVGTERNPSFAVNATLFGESASRIIVSVSSHHLDHVMAEASAAGLTAREIGRIGGEHIRISVNGQVAVDSPVASAETAWATAIENKMRRKPKAD